jgi:hypothetical protein
MNKGVAAAALALTGSLLVGPAAVAAPVEPSGALPGLYTPQHAGHDHGKKPAKTKKGDKKGGKKYSKKSYDGHDHEHGHGHDDWHHHHHDDSAHASGGYDSHRSHPRGWGWGDND